jgi:hypothetical protein
VAEASSHADLSLQNGSEALLLQRGSVLLDRMSWGGIRGLGEGEPAPDVSGESLARIPDGRDTGDDRSDFSPLDPPNPGRANASPTEFRLLGWRLEPPWSAEPGPAALELQLHATGWSEVQNLRLELPDDGVATQLEASRGDTVVMRLDLDLESGRREIRMNLGSATERLPLQIGPSRLRLNEVMARPVAGATEWVELAVAGPDSLDLTGWTLADAGGNARALGDLRLGGESFLVLASRPQGLSLMRPAPVIRPSGGWPALNQSDRDHEDGQSWADELVLRDPRGAAVDWLRWRADEVEEAGRSLERAAVTAATPSLWVAAPRGSTPGAPNDAARYPAPASGLFVAPNPFTPDQDGDADLLHVALRDPATAAEAEAEIVDLSGDRVVRLRPARAREVVEWIWDGRDERGRPVPWGAYLLSVRSDGGRTWRELIAVGAKP